MDEIQITRKWRKKGLDYFTFSDRKTLQKSKKNNNVLNNAIIINKVEIFECGIQVNQKWLNWQKVVENSPVFLASFSTDKKTSQKSNKN